MRILVFLCVAGLLAAQEPSKPDISETFKFILVPVTVTDHDGSFINGLTPLDFHLTDNGQPQKISETSRAIRFRWWWRFRPTATSKRFCLP